MKTFLRLLTLCAVLAGCQSAIRDDANKDTENLEARTSLPRATEPEPMQPTTSKTLNGERDVVGYWVGMFMPSDEEQNKIDTGVYSSEMQFWDYSNKINLSIDSIGGGVVVGHSVVAGNLRPFRGTYKVDGYNFRFEAAEPGDDKYDGRFKFMAQKGGDTVHGTWQSFKPIKIPERKYMLTKQNFRYDVGHKLDESSLYVDWMKTQKTKVPAADEDDAYYDESFFTTTEALHRYNASSQKLSRDAVANLTKADIFILRNAIYARHGYSFKNRQLRAFFDGQPWYIPVKIDVRDELTEMEKENIALLLKFEKHAKEYYDEFGRG